MIHSDTDVTWGAGLFEGEGCIRINKPGKRNWGSLVVSVVNTDAQGTPRVVGLAAFRPSFEKKRSHHKDHEEHEENEERLLQPLCVLCDLCGESSDEGSPMNAAEESLSLHVGPGGRLLVEIPDAKGEAHLYEVETHRGSCWSCSVRRVDTGAVYVVERRDEGAWRCGCPDWKYRGFRLPESCKHVRAARAFLKITEQLASIRG